MTYRTVCVKACERERQPYEYIYFVYIYFVLGTMQFEKYYTCIIFRIAELIPFIKLIDL